MALRLRRGTDAERSIVTPAAGELIYTTDTKKVYVGDGTTTGGIEVGGTGGSSILDLTDVNYGTPQEGDLLTWDSILEIWTLTGRDKIESGLVEGGQYRLSLVADDSSIVFDPAGSGEFFANVTGDVTGSVFGDDSTVLVDGVNNTLAATSIAVSQIVQDAVSVDIIGTSGETTFNVITEDQVSNMSLRRSSSGDISGSDLVYGRIKFERSDTGGDLTTGLIFGKKDGIFITADNTGAFPEASYITINNERLGVGTFDPQVTLDIRGPGVYTGYVQFGSYTTVGRPAGANGMVIYNTTDNRFQGYQNGNWINLDDGSSA